MGINKLRSFYSFSKFRNSRSYERPKADIVEIYIKLVGGETRQSGRATLVKCCFHEERTPSLALYRESQSFYCFGCGKTGDIYTFVKEIKHCDFMKALEIIRNI